jgi:heat shock protein HslJ
MKVKTSSFLAALAIGLSLLAWGASGRAEPLPDSSATSLDWDGVYRGVVPCADCEGIETTLTLRRDGSYHLSMKYLGRSGVAIEREGSFSWDPAGGTIILDGPPDRPNRFLVGENHLLQLDMQGARVTGALADRYRLEKSMQEPDSGIRSLTVTTWQLTELHGEPLAVAAGAKRPHLTLKAQGSQVQGFGGCNSFAGPYELQDGNRIRFGVLAATMMACPEMQVESRFFEVLGMTDNYALTPQGLSLHRARMAPLARFEAATEP